MTRDEHGVVPGLRRLTLILVAALALGLPALQAGLPAESAIPARRPRTPPEPTLTEGPAPAAVRSWMPSDGKSLRYAVAQFGLGQPGAQFHLYTVPNPHHELGTEASLPWVDVFSPSVNGRHPRRLHHIRLPEGQRPAYFGTPMWLEPRRLRGPMVFVYGEDSVVLTFPKGFAGTVCMQHFTSSSTSISATDYSFVEIDKRGFRVMTETISQRDTPDEVISFYWRGEGFAPGHAP